MILMSALQTLSELLTTISSVWRRSLRVVADGHPSLQLRVHLTAPHARAKTREGIRSLGIVSALVANYRKKLNRNSYGQLYESRPYLEAYAAHTDHRVLKDAHAAVGGKWDALGRLQFDYLVANGLKPDSKLLDLGCGTLRGGRHFIRYLNTRNYTGTDISWRAIDYAHHLVMEENLAAKEPSLIYRRPGDAFFADLEDACFDFVLAHSVFTHLPPEFVEECFAAVGRVMRPSGMLFFTFQHEAEHRRRDLKDFAYPSRLFADLADRYDFLFETRNDYNHPRGQTMALLRHR
ncbi:class I SAM-dependent methyltransferase [Methyloceanibacter sp.]|uniref:class I SAM-dependent methyltransferase n=1 Tax=Methyloceanibacter sp. TaxID=1965321 RepID=UPI003D6D3723